MAEEKSSEKTPYDPGWNDPPIFSYDSQKIPRKGCSLNKRVAYRIDSNTPPQGDGNIPSIPPIQAGPPVGPPPLVLQNKPNPVNSQSFNETKPDEEISLSAVLENFNSVIDDVCDKEKERDSFSFKKRIALMESMWIEQKFPQAMQQKLYDISEVQDLINAHESSTFSRLRKNDTETCDILQRSVMVDHTSLCSSWMTAIRSLINAKRSKHL